MAQNSIIHWYITSRIHGLMTISFMDKSTIVYQLSRGFNGSNPYLIVKSHLDPIKQWYHCVTQVGYIVFKIISQVVSFAARPHGSTLQSAALESYLQCSALRAAELGWCQPTSVARVWATLAGAQLHQAPKESPRLKLRNSSCLGRCNCGKSTGDDP